MALAASPATKGSPTGTPTFPPRLTCAGCQHYFITHDASFPYGCRLLGIKSRRQPQLDVIEATGKPCVGYEARDPAKV